MFMYVRMFIALCLNLFTSRILLSNLGINDYGVFNVVGGIITMFSFLNGAMTNTTSRYLTYYLGKANTLRLTNIFNLALLIHFIIAVTVVVLGESVGLWFLFHKMVIPESRMFAAVCLFQFSVISTFLTVITVPFNSMIIAHERMSAFAFISLTDVILKFLIAISLPLWESDKLIIYGALIMSVQILDIFLYFLYCKKKFAETTIRYFWDKLIFKEMFSFAGWSLLGNFSHVFYTQGVNIILNIFCGPAVNAARGVTVQVDSVVRQFATNIQAAINPQIIKSYAENNLERMKILIYASSRYCFYLLFALALPIILEVDFILHTWLVEVPDHTSNFLRITLLTLLLNGMINPMFTANLATGKVKVYHITISVISYLFMPITYFAIKISNQPESVFICGLICGLISLTARIFILKVQIGLSIKEYIKSVLVPNAAVCSLSLIIPLYLHNYVQHDIWGTLITIATSIISVLIMTMVVGLTPQERIFIIEKLKATLNRQQIKE